MKLVAAISGVASSFSVFSFDELRPTLKAFGATYWTTVYQLCATNTRKVYKLVVKPAVVDGYETVLLTKRK